MSTLAFLLIFLLVLYFLPTIIAMRRGRMNTASIAVVNIFLGWTLIGWVLSLAWALAANERAQTR